MSIIYESSLLHIYNGYRSNDFSLRTSMGTDSGITKKICLTKGWNKNIIGASVTASIWKIISKNIS